MITRAEKNKKIRDEIIREENQKRLKKTAKILSSILAIILLILCLGMYVGAKIVVVKEARIENSEIPKSIHGLKVVQISDLLYNSLTKNDLNRIKKQVNEINPDILIFTGDLKRKDIELSKKDIEILENFFKELKATKEKFAVIGENDDDSFYVIMENSNFKVLNNKKESFFYKDATPIDFIGFNTNDLKFDNLDSSVFSICIMHNPDKIEDIIEHVNCRVAFAGDTIGGEIRVFGIPLLDNHKHNKDYEIINNTKLYVSNGLGNECNVRYFNHPSIQLFRLVSY